MGLVVDERRGSTGGKEVAPRALGLEAEKAYFDQVALAMEDRELIIRSDQVERYRGAHHHPLNTAKDTLCAKLLPLEGKRVLDYGCGTGDLGCELGLCGADVVGCDVSPESIKLARRRAELHSVADHVQCEVSQAGHLEYESGTFDIVVGSAVLHHLHTELETIYAEVDRVLRRPGVAYFLEPVANSSTLKRLRSMVPVRCEATPDERQLTYQDFEGLHQYVTEVSIDHFYCLERMHRIFGSTAGIGLRFIDHVFSRGSWLHRFYGKVLVIARR